MTLVTPYIAGPPLREGKGFFGRQEILEWVDFELRNPSNNSLVLSGQRRIGKTSLLLQLQRILLPDFLAIYYDLHDKASWPLGRLLADLAKGAATQAGMDLGSSSTFDDQGQFFRNVFLPQLCERLGEKRRPVFLFDEFDVLGYPISMQWPETAASRALFHFLREVMDNDPRPAFVFVVGRQADDLSQDYRTTFKASLTRKIWVLTEESAKALVRQTEANETLYFTEQAVERILFLTNRHPYLTQLLCQRLWARAYKEIPSESPIIDISDVDAAVPATLEAGDHALYWIWDGLSLSTQFYTAVLADAVGEGKVISKDRATKLLLNEADRLGEWISDSIQLAPFELVKWNVLEDEEQEYRFAVEIFRRWVRSCQPLHKVRAEMETKSISDLLYSVGQQHLSQKQWNKAIETFRLALKENDTHFRAQLHLGNALLGAERAKEAVDELERAYRLKKDEARYPLALALVTYAQKLEASEENNEALRVCERVLEILPDEQKAQEIKAAIWTRRGDAALKRDEWDEALAAYRHAGAEDKIEELLRRQKQKWEELKRNAVTYERAGQWARAAEIYQQLLEEIVDKSFRSELEVALERVRTQEKDELSRVSGIWLPDYVLDDRYKIVELLMETQHRQIYLAEELQPPRQTVVIKRLKPNKLQDEEACKRFEREIVVLRRVRHQSVLFLYDSKTMGQDRYLVTEFADQGTLKEYLATRLDRKLRPMEALEIALSTCLGLEAVHQQGIVHRDVKPGNIFLFSKRDGDIVAKLADFSIARVPEELEDGTLTQVGSFVGTGQYASWEQMRGSEMVDPRSDLYSWAVVFFEMLTGESPTNSLRDPATLFPRADEFPLTFFTERDIPFRFAEVLQKSLYKDRELRHQSAAKVYEALEVIKSQTITDIERHWKLGEEHVRSSEWQVAYAEFEQGLAFCEWYGELDQLRGRVGELARRLRMGHLYAQGMMCLDKQQWQGAIEALKSLHKLAPNYLDFDIATQLGKARIELLIQHQERGDWTQVFRLAEDLIASNEGGYASRLVSGLRDSQASSLPKFLRGESLVSKDDRLQNVYWVLANIYDKFGDRAFWKLCPIEAIRYWRRSLEVFNRAKGYINDNH